MVGEVPGGAEETVGQVKITAPYRGRRATKRLDLTDMRKAFADQRMWCSVGIVTAPDDGGSHFEVTADDVLVEVVLQPSQTPVTCRLSAALWRVPDLGEEVMVQIPSGMVEFMPAITDFLSSGRVPTGQGPALGRVIIERNEVFVHDGAGGAVSLAYLSSLQASIDKLNALVDAYKIHIHSGGVLTGALTGVPTVVAVAHADDAVGTSVLKGK